MLSCLSELPCKCTSVQSSDDAPRTTFVPLDVYGTELLQVVFSFHLSHRIASKSRTENFNISGKDENFPQLIVLEGCRLCFRIVVRINKGYSIENPPFFRRFSFSASAFSCMSFSIWRFLSRSRIDWNFLTIYFWLNYECIFLESKYLTNKKTFINYNFATSASSFEFLSSSMMAFGSTPVDFSFSFWKFEILQTLHYYIFDGLL